LYPGDDEVVGHGTAITSVILGFLITGLGSIDGLANGVAPDATVIPVRVLNQNNSTWSSVLAEQRLDVEPLGEGRIRARHEYPFGPSGRPADRWPDDASEYVRAAVP
jgi:hypothetical protein